MDQRRERVRVVDSQRLARRVAAFEMQATNHQRQLGGQPGSFFDGQSIAQGMQPGAGRVPALRGIVDRELGAPDLGARRRGSVLGPQDEGVAARSADREVRAVQDDRPGRPRRHEIAAARVTLVVALVTLVTLVALVALAVLPEPWSTLYNGR